MCQDMLDFDKQEEVRMKFKLESDFALEIYKIIKSHFITIKANIQIIAEVPRFSHNNHMDMLLIDRKNKRLLGIEFKLNSYESLKKQVKFNPLNTFGILNGKIKESSQIIFPYTGKDVEIETLLRCIGYMYLWSSIYDKINNQVYWWGYLDYVSEINPGIQTGQRESFFEVYQRAVKNFYKKYGGDFYLANSVLRGCYCESTAKKHYKEAIASLK